MGQLIILRAAVVGYPSQYVICHFTDHLPDSHFTGAKTGNKQKCNWTMKAGITSLPSPLLPYLTFSTHPARIIGSLNPAGGLRKLVVHFPASGGNHLANELADDCHMMQS